MILRPLREIDLDIVSALSNGETELVVKFLFERETALELLRLRKKVKSSVSSEIDKEKFRILARAEELVNLSDKPIQQKDLMNILFTMFRESPFTKYWESKGHKMSVTLVKLLNESTKIESFKGENGFHRFYAPKK